MSLVSPAGSTCGEACTQSQKLRRSRRSQSQNYTVTPDQHLRHLETVRLPIIRHPGRQWALPTQTSADPPPTAFARDGQFEFRIRFAYSKSSIHDLECIASLRNPSRTTTRLLPPDRTPIEGCPSTPLRVRLLSLTFEYGFRMTSRDGSSPICSPQAAQQLHLQCTAASCTQLQPW